MDQDVTLKGPIKSCIQIVREQLALLETAEQLQIEGFTELVLGTSLSIDEICDRAAKNCYLHAEEAVKLGLVAGILS
jgi:hypothetical protein